MISIKNLRKRVPGPNGEPIELFNNFDLEVCAGTVMVLLGESGCGKTTLLKVLVGAEKYENGQVTLNGKSPLGACASGLVGFAEQDPTILPWRSLLQNVLLPFKLKGKHSDLDRTRKLLAMVGLKDHQNTRAGKLSGGERKRLGFARAFVDAAGVILLDEPFSSCDLKTRLSMYDTLGAFFREFILNSTRTLLLVTHSIEEAALLGMQASILRGGRPCTLFEKIGLNNEPLPSTAMFADSPLNTDFESNVRTLREACLRGWTSLPNEASGELKQTSESA